MRPIILSFLSQRLRVRSSTFPRTFWSPRPCSGSGSYRRRSPDIEADARNDEDRPDDNGDYDRWRKILLHNATSLRTNTCSAIFADADSFFRVAAILPVF